MGDGGEVVWSSGELSTLVRWEVGLYQHDPWAYFNSLAIGVKMNILLFVPGLAVLLVQYQGIKRTIGCFGLMALIQVSFLRLVLRTTLANFQSSLHCPFFLQILLPLPFFLSTPQLAKSYFTSAFNFSRQFLFKWSVNWNFVGKEIFEGDQMSKMLLGGHVRVP